MRGMGSRGTRAAEVLRSAGISFEMHEYEHAASGTTRERRPGYGEEAAMALGVDPARVLKTLIADIDGRLATAVVPVSGELDLKRLAETLGGRRASLAGPVDAERATGYVAGGISPLGQRRTLRAVIDRSALAWPTVFVSGGRRGLDLELAPSDLVRLTGASVADIGRPRTA
jgi:Cys-tRNA(Pro)/Cys-tRNA(Cys) deacylase